MPHTIDTTPAGGPHAGRPVLHAGPELDQAERVAVMVHGRGGRAEDMLSLHRALDVPTLAALAPQASENTWYPQSFMAPGEANREGIASVHAVLESIIEQLDALGVPSERVVLIGFSQGACVAADHPARFPRRYALVAALTGGLIGPENTDFDTLQGDLQATPVFLGANDPDPHVPWSRVETSAAVLERMGAKVTIKRYPGEPHAVNRDQVETVRAMLGG
ncbi:MAG: phospholipase [Phycisphaerales bacterium]|nr:MAG: phospholipase [Phycisphaerales bacterium]